MNGWIKLHRELLEKTIWINSTVEQKALLITIMLLASHIDNEWEWNGKRFRVKPGQFITSTRTLAEAAGVTHRNVRSALLRFEKHEFLTQEATHTGTLITIANYTKYQVPIGGSTKQSTKQSTGNQHAINTPANTPANNNELNTIRDIDIYTSSDTDTAEKIQREILLWENNLDSSDPEVRDYAPNRIEELKAML